MVIYELVCKQGHRFEGWFDNRDDFVHQLDEGMIACPLCDATEVVERPVAPAVHIGGRARRAASREAQGERPVDDERPADGEAPGDAERRAEALKARLTGERVTALRAMSEAVKEVLEKHFDDVGGRFAEEAIAIHLGDAETRNISGTATSEEEEELDELGVPYGKLRLPHFDD